MNRKKNTKTKGAAVLMVLSLAMVLCFGIIGSAGAEELVQGGTYQSETLGNVLYLDDEDPVKTVQEETAEKAVAAETSGSQILVDQYGRRLESLGRFKLTGYCSCELCSEEYGTETATGVQAKAGRTVAVDPKVIPYGTHLLINGHEYVAEDCGGLVKNRHVDIYFDTHEEASNFLTYSDVYIIH